LTPRKVDPEILPDGRFKRRFRRYKPGIAPPPSSAAYGADPHYAAQSDWNHDPISTAIGPHRGSGRSVTGRPPTDRGLLFSRTVLRCVAASFQNGSALDCRQPHLTVTSLGNQ
jgi:hypothetical protein